MQTELRTTGQRGRAFFAGPSPVALKRLAHDGLCAGLHVRLRAGTRATCQRQPQPTRTLAACSLPGETRFRSSSCVSGRFTSSGSGSIPSWTAGTRVHASGQGAWSGLPREPPISGMDGARACLYHCSSCCTRDLTSSRRTLVLSKLRGRLASTCADQASSLRCSTVLVLWETQAPRLAGKNIHIGISL